ncbi:hypothetical protein ACP70R_048180 [Stipagrostis hirtigluma subsp. patula]
MCGCSCDDCIDSVCCCIPYAIRSNIKPCLCILGVAVAVCAVITGIVILLAYGLPPRDVKITVEDASLTRFALVTTPTTALAYNLTVALTVRNPNWALGIKHDKPLEAAYSFDGQPFDRVKVADEGDKLGARKTVVYRLASGSADGRGVALGNAGEAEFRKQNATGVFEVEMALTGKFKYKLRYTKCKMEATCKLKLQLAPPGTTAVVFQKVKCELAKQEDKYC